MNLLIKQARILDPNSSQNGKKLDILIENGKITSIRKSISSKVKTITDPNLHVSPGWFDMHVNFRDPGYEHKEDLNSGMRAASFGGFTGVACMPGTNPPLHTKSEIEYILHKSKGSIVDVHPIGALSYELKGKDMTEMYDMHLSGAVAFSDEKHPVKSAGLMLRSLLYVNGFNGLIISHSEDKEITLDGMMNEGEAQSSLGLNPMPAIAEELMVARDISLVDYAKSRIHISSVSSAKTVDLIRAAKRKGINITAEVAAHYLGVDDSALEGFESNYKVNPPFRGKKDIQALKRGLADGSIDTICSDHSPEDEEMKNREFDHAAFGIIGLETAYAAANTYSGLNKKELIQKMAIRPREILNIPVPVIDRGQDANITLFNPTQKWTYSKSDIKSKSGNTPFVGTTFTGKALGAYNNSQYYAAK